MLFIISTWTWQLLHSDIPKTKTGHYCAEEKPVNKPHPLGEIFCFLFYIQACPAVNGCYVHSSQPYQPARQPNPKLCFPLHSTRHHQFWQWVVPPKKDPKNSPHQGWTCLASATVLCRPTAAVASCCATVNLTTAHVRCTPDHLGLVFFFVCVFVSYAVLAMFPFLKPSIWRCCFCCAALFDPSCIRRSSMQMPWLENNPLPLA